MHCGEECLWLKLGQSKACEACKTRQVQCLLGGEPVASKSKTEDRAEQGDGSPKKKKCKVVSKETIKESKAKRPTKGLRPSGCEPSGSSLRRCA